MHVNTCMATSATRCGSCARSADVHTATHCATLPTRSRTTKPAHTMLKLCVAAVMLLPGVAAQSCTLDPCVREQYVTAMTTACSAASDNTQADGTLCTAVFDNSVQDGPSCQGLADNAAGTTTCSWAEGTMSGQEKFNGLDTGNYFPSTSGLCAVGSASESDCTAASATVVTAVNDCADGACQDGSVPDSLPLAVGTAACVFDAGTAQADHSCNDASDTDSCTCVVTCGAFDCSGETTNTVAKPTSTVCATATCAASDCCTAPPPPPPTDTSDQFVAGPLAVVVVALGAATVM